MEIGSNIEILGNGRNKLKNEEEQREAIQLVNSQNQIPALAQHELLAVTAAELGNSQLTENDIDVDAGCICWGLESAALADFKTKILFSLCLFGSPLHILNPV